MFAKIFESIYDGTLADHWQALVTFQQMLILADANGIVDMTPVAMHRRTGIPLDVIQDGIKVLEQPDPASRSAALEGRRIARLDDGRTWGWFLVNHADYRKKVSAEEKREADRLRLASKRYVAGCRVPSRAVADVAQADADAEAEESKERKPTAYESEQSSDPPPSENGEEAEQPPTDAENGATDAAHSRCPIKQIVALYHEKLPVCPRVVKITDTRAGYIRQRWRDDLQSLDAWRNFFDDVSTSRFLTGKAKGRDGQPPFVADLEWLCRPGNFAKVAEGKYHRGL